MKLLKPSEAKYRIMVVAYFSSAKYNSRIAYLSINPGTLFRSTATKCVAGCTVVIRDSNAQIGPLLSQFETGVFHN